MPQKGKERAEVNMLLSRELVVKPGNHALEPLLLTASKVAFGHLCGLGPGC